MKFSVIVPVYNSEKFLRNCIESILNQTFIDFEVIVINDGSTDSSSKILNYYAKNDSRMKVYHCENNGVTKARQIGVSLSNGEYIIFVDSDDTINSNLLFELENTLKKYPDIDIVRFKAKLINDTVGLDHDIYNITSYMCQEPITGIQAIKQWTNPCKKYDVFWLYTFKKTTLSIMNLCPNISTNEDFAIIPLIIAKAKSVTMIDYIGYNYTCNNLNSLTHKSGYSAQKKHALDFLIAYNFLMQNISIIEIESKENFDFFYANYKKRLQRRYSSLVESLKIELRDLFSFSKNNW